MATDISISVISSLPSPIIHTYVPEPSGTTITETYRTVTQTRKPDGDRAGAGIVVGPDKHKHTEYLPAIVGLQALQTPTGTPKTPDNEASPTPTTVETNSTTGPNSLKSSSNASSQTSTAAPRSSSTVNSNPTISAGSANVRSGSGNIGPGAAAGIGIGCAIAGALIAAVILVFFFRRRRRRAPARSDAIPLNGFASVEKTIASPDSISPAAMIERNLPQPAEDQALGGEMSRLKTAIKNHVQSYYHTNSVRGSVDQVALGVIATGNMPLIASTLASLLSNPVTRMTAIRFCITWTVVSRIDQNCEPSLSFLPPEIASCLLSISSTRDDPSSKCPI